MLYDNSHCNTYEEFCEEILAYMRCQDESFDFGEGLMEMGIRDGEHGMYKVAILPYLNDSYYEETDFYKWYNEQEREKLNRKLESKFDELSNEKLQNKLFNKYDKNMKWKRKRRKSKVSEIINPTYEVKLNSEFVDLIECDEFEENKVILQQFQGEEDVVYLCLNNRQVKVDINSLYRTVKFMFGEYTDSLN